MSRKATRKKVSTVKFHKQTLHKRKVNAHHFESWKYGGVWTADQFSSFGSVEVYGILHGTKSEFPDRTNEVCSKIEILSVHISESIKNEYWKTDSTIFQPLYVQWRVSNPCILHFWVDIKVRMSQHTSCKPSDFHYKGTLLSQTERKCFYSVIKICFLFRSCTQ